MGTTAYKSFGTKLKRGDGQSPQTFTQVPNCGDIDGPKTKKTFEETTNHSSATQSGGYVEYVPSLKDGDSVKTTVNWVPTDPVHIGLQQDLDSDRLVDWQIEYPTTPLWTVSFKGYIESFDFKAPVKGITQRELVIKVTGAVTVPTS